MEKFAFNVKSESKLRLDKFLSLEFSNLKPEITRNKIQNLIKKNCVKNQHNETINDVSYKVEFGQKFLVEIPKNDESHLQPKEIPFEIIFEDQDLIVINKPAGLTVHPGNGNRDNTLVNALLFSHQNNLSQINGNWRPGIVHRLDKDTSGLMVIAKNDLAHLELAKQIANRNLKRNYLAFCYGVPKPFNGLIKKNIGRGKINRLKMVIMKNGGKNAITHYRVKKTYQDFSCSLTECELETGRTHQIRVHMSSIGHSLIGDQLYGARHKSLKNISPELAQFINHFPRQALHSYKIAFLHPIQKIPLEFCIELSDDLKQLEKKLISS